MSTIHTLDLSGIMKVSFKYSRMRNHSSSFETLHSKIFQHTVVNNALCFHSKGKVLWLLLKFSESIKTFYAPPRPFFGDMHQKQHTHTKCYQTSLPSRKEAVLLRHLAPSPYSLVSVDCRPKHFLLAYLTTISGDFKGVSSSYFLMVNTKVLCQLKLQ